MAAIDQLTLRGFKSIRDLTDFKLEKLNILVGANGAGKSNLVDFFRMLKAMADGALPGFVTENGGGDGFLFNGPKETPEIFAHLKFGCNQFRFRLAATVTGDLMVAEEATLYVGGIHPSDWHIWKGRKKSVLPSWKEDQSASGDHLSEQGHVYDAISRWRLYHFHDTGNTAAMRRKGSARDFRELRPDAGNIAAFLLKMREDHAAAYQRIRETIRLIAPFFDDFLLEPQTEGERELVRLEWLQPGSTFPFQPWQLSDGTIRFICLVTALLQPVRPSTIVIDEPELGLHPVAIAALAALLHETSRQTQLVVTTQSVELLDYFDPEQIIVVELEGGASVFKRLEREPLEQWLEDYSLGELVRKDIIETGPRHD